ncbi:molybdate ABC transporter substrate-binding protein [Aminiphilus sp.]|uniref:molybdate ABC transporter substrate-binding protein n=1 Tax=Aminiphilus sp. TaxID=1872488 RepID=UPI00263834DB|nr:molybdate ABC transporter substrate-binding protein [Aminiphilus sp.]
MRFMRLTRVRLSAGFLMLLLCLGSAMPLGATTKELYMHCGAGLRQPVEELLRTYREKGGVNVAVEYAGSGQSLVRFKATKEGDLFLSGSAFFVEQLAKDGFVTHSFSIVLHPPVLAVHPSKTGEITTVDDLAKPGVRVGLGDPKAMALGRTAEEILSHSDKKDAILANTVVRAATVKQLSLYVTKGDVDAAILARSDAVQAKDALVFFDIDPAWYTPEIVTIAALNTSRHPEEALELAEFLRSPEAVAVFLSHGFSPLP